MGHLRKCQLGGWGQGSAAQSAAGVLDRIQVEGVACTRACQRAGQDEFRGQIRRTAGVRECDETCGQTDQTEGSFEYQLPSLDTIL